MSLLLEQNISFVLLWSSACGKSKADQGAQNAHFSFKQLQPSFLVVVAEPLSETRHSWQGTIESTATSNTPKIVKQDKCNTETVYICKGCNGAEPSCLQSRNQELLAVLMKIHAVGSSTETPRANYKILATTSFCQIWPFISYQYGPSCAKKVSIPPGLAYLR